MRVNDRIVIVIAEDIRKAVEIALEKVGIRPISFTVEHPAEMEHGDYATNVAMVVFGRRASGQHSGDAVLAHGGEVPKSDSPRELAQKLIQELVLEQVEKIEIAEPGFINFHLKRGFFVESLNDIQKASERFGKNERLKDRKVIVEYTDPNPFKEFHIGHLMSNTVGEVFARILEYSGAEVRRVNYQGDVGLHVAKAIWGRMQEQKLSWQDSYALGSRLYDSHKKEINELNKTIYERSDKKINELYDEGKKESLARFEEMYAVLGTKFDEYFFESQAAEPGEKAVEKNIGDVFIKSEGAVVFSEEKSGLHTRVFLNSQGLPTYEAKELALAKLKHDWWAYDESIIVTGNEIDEYFKVLLKAMEFVYPELAEKTKHMSHGMLRLPSGKMSSRTGDVITAMSLIEEIKEQALGRMEDKNEKIAEQVAVGAIKYEVLKQAPGKDIIFDAKKALSLEGDSGPYLQYTLVRANSVLAKAQELGVKPTTHNPQPKTTTVERLLYRFPEIVDTASREYAPHKIVHFLLEVASSFNNFYAKEKIADADDEYSPYKLAITQAVATVLANGLFVLGIPAPERM